MFSMGLLKIIENTKLKYFIEKRKKKNEICLQWIFFKKKIIFNVFSLYKLKIYGGEFNHELNIREIKPKQIIKKSFIFKI